MTSLTLIIFANFPFFFFFAINRIDDQLRKVFFETVGSVSSFFSDKIDIFCHPVRLLKF